MFKGYKPGYSSIAVSPLQREDSNRKPFPNPLSSSRLLLAALCLAGCTTCLAQDVTTAHNNNGRTGEQSAETVLTPANASAANFGKLFSFPVVGDIYAQPLYLHQFWIDGRLRNVLLVATSRDYVYAFDADGGNPKQGYLWRRSLLGAGETWVSNNDVNTSDITPHIGVTGTPVIDRSHCTLYVVAKSKTINGSTFIQRLHALDLATGAEKLNGPTEIHATVPGAGDGSTTVSFSPLLNNQRAALLLAPTPQAPTAESVFIGWSSHGDNGAYHGWIISYDAQDISRQTGKWTDTPNGAQGGIWMSGGGLSSDGEGNIFAAGGNGTFDADLDGPDFGDSAFRLTLTKAGLSARDTFTPADELSLDQTDNDMGTSALMLLPTQYGVTPHLLVTTDKSGTAYLLNRDKMGDFTQPNNSSLQSFSIGWQVHSSFAIFDNRIYLAGDGGPLEAWKFNPKTERFDATPASQSVATFGLADNDGGGTTPSISTNAGKNPVLWALDNSGFGSTPAVLRAYNPYDLTEVYYDTAKDSLQDAAAIAVKFTTPTIANGKVYVGGRNAVTIYGLHSQGAAPTVAPSFTPAAGTYTTAQTVSLSSTMPNASIYYTTDGSLPGTGSTLYTGPIVISEQKTVRAVAIAPGHSVSASSQATYIISVATSGNGAVPYGNGFPASSMLLNGSAKLDGALLRLTDGNPQQAGSAFFPSKVHVQKFTNDFDFRLSAATADGFTFVIQNAGKNALGTLGGGLGYGSDATGTSGIQSAIGASVAIKFDIYNNEGEGTDSTGLYQNGASPEQPSVDLSATGIQFANGDPFHAHMVYDGTTLQVSITDKTTQASASQSYKVDIPTIVGGSTAYVGFTGGSGGLTAIQDILEWVYQ